MFGTPTGAGQRAIEREPHCRSEFVCVASLLQYWGLLQVGLLMRVARVLRAGLALVALVSVAYSDGGRAMDGMDVKIYYIPFQYETYAPVTIDSIEKTAICALGISSRSEDAAVIREVVESTTGGGFDGSFVRAKIAGLWANDIFIDKYGGILDGTRKRRLSEEAFGKLSTLLNALATAQGCED